MSLRHNNFDLLASVLRWHQFSVSKTSALEVLGRLASADLGVKGVVSGDLVVISCERSASLREKPFLGTKSHYRLAEGENRKRSRLAA
jgi:hypothetical protein